MAQALGGISGTSAQMMFELPTLKLSTTARTGLWQYFSEIITTFGLLVSIFIGVKHKVGAVPALVALYIAAPYWFTASTSFANPAVIIADNFSDTFSVINFDDIRLFIAGQIIGAVFAFFLYRILETDD